MRTRQLAGSFAVAGLALLLLASTAVAAPRLLTAQECVQIALRQSPELLPARKATEQARGILAHAEDDSGLLPQVGLQTGIRRTAVGDTRPEITASITQPLRVGAVAPRRREHAQALVHSSEAEQVEREHDLAQEVLQLWLLLQHWERVELHHAEAVGRARQLSELVAHRVSIGASQPGDDSSARADLGRRSALHQRARLERAAVVAELQLLLETPLDEELSTSGRLDLPESQALAMRGTLHPSAATLLAQADQQQRQAQWELGEAAPQVAVGASVTREGTSDWVIMGQVSVPLPLGQPAMYAARVAERRVSALQLEAHHSKERFARMSRQLAQRSEHQRVLLQHIEQQQVEPARQTLRITEAQFHAAKVPLQAVLLARDRVADAELQLLEARYELEQQRVRQAWLDGTLLSWARGER